MPTKEAKRHAKGVIEGLENRIHFGPPIGDTEIQAAQEFLRQHDFSPASDYFSRLVEVQSRLRTRVRAPVVTTAKRNYGGEAGGRFMQIQTVYDHVILSTCYDGEFRTQRGRIKLSHRFNQAGRIEFVELKFLSSLQTCLDGQIRKLLLVRDYQTIRKDWLAAEAFVLPALPRELMFLHCDLFRFPRPQLLAWLVNIGHGIVQEMLAGFKTLPAFAAARRSDPWAANAALAVNGPPRWVADNCGREVSSLAPASPPGHALGGNTNGSGRRSDQLQLEAIRGDAGALALLEAVAAHEAVVEERDAKTVLVRCVRQGG